jgi:hypothetical protein
MGAEVETTIVVLDRVLKALKQELEATRDATKRLEELVKRLKNREG